VARQQNDRFRLRRISPRPDLVPLIGKRGRKANAGQLQLKIFPFLQL
jgi:hypothetical protein